MKETWKPIPNIPGYEASSLGRIRSIDRRDRFGRLNKGRVLRPYKDKNDRLFVYPRVGNKTLSCLVHRLVLLAHVGPCPDGMECCHFDDDQANNKLSNLRWGDKRSNTADQVRNGLTNRGEQASFARLTEADVHAIRADSRTISAIADAYGVSRGAVIGVVYGANWKHVPLRDDAIPRPTKR